MDVSRITSQHLIGERLDANYYGTQFLKNEAFLNKCGLPFERIGSLAVKCNCGATPKEVNYDGAGQGLIRTSDVRPNYFAIDKVLRTSELKVRRESNVAALSNDLLYTMSGTIGYAAVIPETDEIFSFSNTIARVRFPKDGPHDPRFMATFFNCKYGYKQSLRLVSGGIQGHVMPNPFKNLLVPTPHPLAQKYIGEKVRQAERLRARASKAQRIAKTIYLERLLRLGYKEVLSMKSYRINLVERLDPAYYSPEFASVLDAEWLTSNSQPLANFIAEGTYGILPDSSSYGTGTARLLRATDLATCGFDPNAGVLVPVEQTQDKAKVKRNDILLEVKGAIERCTIASQLAAGTYVNGSVYRFAVKDIPLGYLAVHLTGPIKKKYCSREAVNNIIQYLNLDCIHRLPVLRLPSDVEEEISNQYLRSVDSLIYSFALMTTAKQLVEALIEGKVTEAELKEPQEGMGRGDTSADRALLSRLTRKGIDVAGELPLFPDLDALYQTLEQVTVMDGHLQEA